jgi:hypothetical protein
MENDTSQMKNGKSKDLKTFASLLKLFFYTFLSIFTRHCVGIASLANGRQDACAPGLKNIFLA